MWPEARARYAALMRGSHTSPARPQQLRHDVASRRVVAPSPSRSAFHRRSRRGSIRPCIARMPRAISIPTAVAPSLTLASDVTLAALDAEPYCAQARRRVEFAGCQRCAVGSAIGPARPLHPRAARRPIDIAWQGPVLTAASSTRPGAELIAEAPWCGSMITMSSLLVDKMPLPELIRRW